MPNSDRTTSVAFCIKSLKNSEKSFCVFSDKKKKNLCSNTYLHKTFKRRAQTNRKFVWKKKSERRLVCIGQLFFWELQKSSSKSLHFGNELETRWGRWYFGKQVLKQFRHTLHQKWHSCVPDRLVIYLASKRKVYLK